MQLKLYMNLLIIIKILSRFYLRLHNITQSSNDLTTLLIDGQIIINLPIHKLFQFMNKCFPIIPYME